MRWRMSHLQSMVTSIICMGVRPILSLWIQTPLAIATLFNISFHFLCYFCFSSLSLWTIILIKHHLVYKVPNLFILILINLLGQNIHPHHRHCMYLILHIIMVNHPLSLHHHNHQVWGLKSRSLNPNPLNLNLTIKFPYLKTFIS